MRDYQRDLKVTQKVINEYRRCIKERINYMDPAIKCDFCIEFKPCGNCPNEIYNDGIWCMDQPTFYSQSPYDPFEVALPKMKARIEHLKRMKRRIRYRMKKGGIMKYKFRGHENIGNHMVGGTPYDNEIECPDCQGPACFDGCEHFWRCPDYVTEDEWEEKKLDRAGELSLDIESINEMIEKECGDSNLDRVISHFEDIKNKITAFIDWAE